MKLLRYIHDHCLPLRHGWLTYAAISALSLFMTTVNVTTAVTNAERSGININANLIWAYELTSVSLIILLFPLVALAVRRYPISHARWAKHLAFHAGFSVLFSAVHVTGMVLLRKLYFILFVGRPYEFFGDVMRESFYEYRKDAVTYALIVIFLHMVTALARRDADIEQALAKLDTPALPARLALKSGGTTVWIAAADFRFAKGAGNYVEVHAADHMHLVRQSLAKLEEQLREAGVAAVRIHRSYLASQDAIVRVKPKADGDAEAILENGESLPVSRRYRQNLTP